MHHQYSWYRLFYSALLSACSALIVSASLAMALRQQMMKPVQPGWEVHTGAALWLGLGVLCFMPALWTVAKRVRQSSCGPEQTWRWREASMLSLASTTAWWFAPALWSSPL